MVIETNFKLNWAMVEIRLVRQITTIEGNTRFVNHEPISKNMVATWRMLGMVKPV